MFSVKYLSCCENYAIFAKHKQKSMNKTYFKYKYVFNIHSFIACFYRWTKLQTLVCY